MKYFEIKLSLDQDQAHLMDTVKSNGGDVIQTSSGLCVKIEKDLDQLRSLFPSEGLTVRELDRSAVIASHDTAPDIKNFLS